MPVGFFVIKLSCPPPGWTALAVEVSLILLLLLILLVLLFIPSPCFSSSPSCETGGPLSLLPSVRSDQHWFSYAATSHGKAHPADSDLGLLTNNGGSSKEMCLMMTLTPLRHRKTAQPGETPPTAAHPLLALAE